jgi:hypothetical protein
MGLVIHLALLNDLLNVIPIRMNKGIEIHVINKIKYYAQLIANQQSKHLCLGRVEISPCRIYFLEALNLPFMGEKVFAEIKLPAF